MSALPNTCSKIALLCQFCRSCFFVKLAALCEATNSKFQTCSTNVWMNLTLLRRYVYLPAQPHRSNFYCVSEMKCPALSIKQHHLSHTCDDENALGSECVFSCSAGYRLVGSSTMLCGQNKSWQPTASPRCGKYVACVGVGRVIMGWRKVIL